MLSRMANAPGTPAGRLVALDVFRGVTMASMVIVNNPGDWGHVYWPLLHAEWHGCTPTDLIFPFFLFIVGFAITLSRRSASYGAILKRGALLIGVGLFLAGYPRFDIHAWRIPGVLQRIGLCYLAAGALYRWLSAREGGKVPARDVGRGLLVATVACLMGYYLLQLAIPGATGQRFDLSAEGNIGARLDRILLAGHTWKPNWDPEGLLSTLPAIGTTLIGTIAGLRFRMAADLASRIRSLVWLGAIAVGLGLVWSLHLPLNKSIWTSSYAAFTAGLAALFLALSLWVIDLKGWRRPVYPFVVLGTNALALFALSALVVKTLMRIKVTWSDGALIGSHTYLYRAWVEPLFASPYNASLAYAVVNLVVLYGVLWVMYKRGIFVKV